MYVDHGASQSEQRTYGFVFCHGTQTVFALATEFVSQDSYIDIGLLAKCNKLIEYRTTHLFSLADAANAAVSVAG